MDKEKWHGALEVAEGLCYTKFFFLQVENYDENTFCLMCCYLSKGFLIFFVNNICYWSRPCQEVYYKSQITYGENNHKIINWYNKFHWCIICFNGQYETFFWLYDNDIKELYG